MATILNKTPRPLKIPLPGGKFLRLAPRKTGEVHAKALEHPPFQAFVEEGSIEVVDAGRRSPGAGGGSSGLNSRTGRDPDRTIRHVGDG